MHMLSSNFILQYVTIFEQIKHQFYLHRDVLMTHGQGDVNKTASWVGALGTEKFEDLLWVCVRTRN